MKKAKYKVGDLLTDKGDSTDGTWSVWEVIAFHQESTSYWLINRYYHQADTNTLAASMCIHNEDYMDLIEMKKLNKNDMPEIIAKIL